MGAIYLLTTQRCVHFVACFVLFAIGIERLDLWNKHLTTGDSNMAQK